MGKCEWVVSKGKKKGEICNIYSNKKHDGKYYCSSHMKMIVVLDSEPEEENEEIPVIKNKETPPKSRVKKVRTSSPIKIEKPKKSTSGSKTSKKFKKLKKEESDHSENLESTEEAPNLSTHSLDDVIEYEYQKSVKNEIEKSDFQKLSEKVDYLMNKVNELIGNRSDGGIPPFEENKKNIQKQLKYEDFDFDDVKNIISNELNDVPKMEVFK